MISRFKPPNESIPVINAHTCIKIDAKINVIKPPPEIQNHKCFSGFAHDARYYFCLFNLVGLHCSACNGPYNYQQIKNDEILSNVVYITAEAPIPISQWWILRIPPISAKYPIFVLVWFFGFPYSDHDAFTYASYWTSTGCPCYTGPGSLLLIRSSRTIWLLCSKVPWFEGAGRRGIRWVRKIGIWILEVMIWLKKLVKKLVPCVWLLSGALEVWRLRWMTLKFWENKTTWNFSDLTCCKYSKMLTA